MESTDISKIMQSFFTHINNERNLAFLLGAGISISFVPAIDKITANIEALINSSGDLKKINAWKIIKDDRFQHQGLYKWNVSWIRPEAYAKLS